MDLVVANHNAMSQLVRRLMDPPRVTRFRIGGTSFVVMSYEPLPPALRDRLTPAEREVAEELFAGRSDAEIATLRGTSVRTVRNQVAAIYDKMREELDARPSEEPRTSHVAVRRAPPRTVSGVVPASVSPPDEDDVSGELG